MYFLELEFYAAHCCSLATADIGTLLLYYYIIILLYYYIIILLYYYIIILLYYYEIFKEELMCCVGHDLVNFVLGYFATAASSGHYRSYLLLEQGIHDNTLCCSFYMCISSFLLHT